jgi:hypothetical protein
VLTVLGRWRWRSRPRTRPARSSAACSSTRRHIPPSLPPSLSLASHTAQEYALQLVRDGCARVFSAARPQLELQAIEQEAKTAKRGVRGGCREEGVVCDVIALARLRCECCASADAGRGQFWATYDESQDRADSEEEEAAGPATSLTRCARCLLSLCLSFTLSVAGGLTA